MKQVVGEKCVVLLVTINILGIITCKTVQFKSETLCHFCRIGFKEIRLNSLLMRPIMV